MDVASQFLSHHLEDSIDWDSENPPWREDPVQFQRSRGGLLKSGVLNMSPCWFQARKDVIEPTHIPHSVTKVENRDLSIQWAPHAAS